MAVKLPDSRILGERQDISARPAVQGPNPRAMAAPAAAAEEASLRTAQSGQHMTVAADRFAAMDARAREGEWAVDRARKRGEYQLIAQKELERLSTEGDMSKQETLAQYNTVLQEAQRKILSEHPGGKESAARLSAQLEESRFSFVVDAGRKGAEARHKLVLGNITNNIGQFTAEANSSPGKLIDIWRRFDALVDDTAPALTPEMETATRSAGRREIALSALNSLVARGSAKDARELIASTPGLLSGLAPEQQRTIEGRLASAERAQDEARSAGLRKIEETTQILGRPPTLAERIKLAGVADADKDKSPAAKLHEMETALGRPLSNSEKTKALGVYIEQKGVDLSSVAGMRKEFTNQSGDFIKVRDAYNKIAATAANPSPAGDMALIFNYMKMLDPGSTVREGEYATAQNAGSVPDRVWAQYNKAVAGESLAPPQRSDFLKQSKNLYDSQLKTQKALEKTYRGLAERAGFNPDDVAPDMAGENPGSVSGPAAAPVIQYGLGGQRIGAVKK